MSNEVKTKEKIDMDPKYIVKLTVTLLGTCLIVALLLGLVNGVTAGPIAEINQQKTEAAMLAVVSDPDNTTFSDALELSGDMTAAATAAGGTLNEMYEVQVNGEAAGYAVKVTASGSQGSIEMMAPSLAFLSSTTLRPPASARRSWATNPPPPAWVCWTSLSARARRTAL